MNDPFAFPENYSYIGVDDYSWFCAIPNGQDGLYVFYTSPTSSQRVIRVTYNYRNFKWLYNTLSTPSSTNCTGYAAHVNNGDVASYFPPVFYSGIWSFAGIIIGLFIYMLFKVFKR